MYDFRKISSDSFSKSFLVLLIVCTIIFACANNENANQKKEFSDDPSKIVEPVEGPGNPQTEPFDKQIEPDEKPAIEEPDHPSSEKTKPSKETTIKKNNSTKKPITSSGNKTNPPIKSNPNNKLQEGGGLFVPKPDERKQLLEGAVNFIQGNMVYAIPDSMPLKEVSKVSLVIGSRNNLETIKKKALELSGVKDSNQINTAKSITIGRKMKAVLNDPKAKVSPAFEISSLTSEEQFVDLYNNESVDWLWSVIPLKSGAHELSMTLEVTLINDLGESIRSIPVYNDKVKIFVPKKTKIPASYDIVAMPNDTSSATVQNNSLNAEANQQPEKSGNSYVGLIAGGSIISLGILLFIFFNKKSNSSVNTLLGDFSVEEVKELDRLQNKGDIQQALRYILEKLPDIDPRRNEVELLWQNYKDNEKDNAQNLIAYEQYTQARSKISLAVITLIDEIRDLSNIEENNQPA